MTVQKDYTPPSLEADAFNCPYCEAYASQTWSSLLLDVDNLRGPTPAVKDAKRGKCKNCGNYHLWIGEDMIYPKFSPAPLPADEMPEDVEADYREARQVVPESPKAAAALLRRAIESLIEHLLDDPDEHLYSDIEALSEEGIIDDRIRRAFDTIRISGNDYTHAGRIYADDNRKKALQLFELTNIIVRTTIAEDRLIDELYSDIPDTKKRESN